MNLRLEEKVAQLFMVGSDTENLADEIEPFFRVGLGGVLLFRHHLQLFSTAPDLKDYLSNFSKQFGGAGLTFTAIDQEGGQVERLPHWIFPTGVFAWVFGAKGDLAYCSRVQSEVAKRLRWLGINLNFTPTVDLNTETRNPIIGVRAYGSTAEAVIPFGQAVMQAHLEAGVLPVAKHFPGHGSGTVDSHLDLPCFEHWQEAELLPYRHLIAAGLPAVLIAHGLYPQLAKQLGANPEQPASLSNAITTQLLRAQFGFNGMVLTDDMMMGAVWQDADPIETALQAFHAGADMLIYRCAQPEAWLAYEAILSRVKSGKIAEAQIDEKVARILKAKQRSAAQAMPHYRPDAWTSEACGELALSWAQEGLVEYSHQFLSPLPFSQYTRWGLVMPDRNSMRHYAPDALHGKDLLQWCAYYSVSPSVHQAYPVGAQTAWTADPWEDMLLENIVFIAFNSVLSPAQQKAYQTLKTQHPEAKIILASCGMPSDSEILVAPWIHVQMPSYRPAAMQAFVQWLISPTR